MAHCLQAAHVATLVLSHTRRTPKDGTSVITKEDIVSLVTAECSSVTGGLVLGGIHRCPEKTPAASASGTSSAAAGSRL